MPLPSTSLLSSHFTAFELGADKPEADARIIANLRQTAEALEDVRAILNSRLQVNTSRLRNRGFRTPAQNIAVGGSPTTSHDDGDAADFVPLDFPGSKLDAHKLLIQAQRDGRLGPFDQIIYYPIQGHIHYGRGPRMRGEFRVNLYEGSGGTPLVTAENIKALGAQVAAIVSANPLLSLVLFAGVAYAVVSLLT